MFRKFMNYFGMFVIFSLLFGWASSSSYYFNLIVGDQSNVIYDNDNNLNNDSGPIEIGDYSYYASLMSGSSNLFKLKIGRQSSQNVSGYILTGGVPYKIMLGSSSVMHTVVLKSGSESGANIYNNTTTYVRQTTKYQTPESCKNSSLTGIILSSFSSYQTYQVNECYKERGFGNNNMYFHIVSKDEVYNPSKIIYPFDVIDKSGAVRQLSFVNNRSDWSFYIPYDTGINCDDYRKGKTAVKDRNYFDVICEGCGKFNGQDVTGSIVTGYATQGGNCDYKIFDCPAGSNSWYPSNDVSSYPYLSCNKDCTDWRNGSSVKFVHGTVVTGYSLSNAPSCSGLSAQFICQNGLWSGSKDTSSYKNTNCLEVSVITGSCNALTSGQNLFSYPSANKCSTYASIIDDDAVGNDGVFNWRCMGTGGGADQACSADRVYSGYTCQFDSYDNPVGSGILVWRSVGSLGKPLSSTGTNYNIGYSINAINAGSYVCVANAQCGSANANLVTSYPDVHTLCERSKYIVNNDTDGTDGTYNWTCAGFAGAASNVACSATKVAVVNGACGSASGLNFSVEPSDSQLCTSGSTVNKTVSWNSTSYNSIFSWSCNGTGGGTNASCNLNKVYPYHQYQCQLSGKIALNWMPINYPNNGSVSYSSKLNYGSGNYVYASPISGDPYYVGAYVCRASGVCGDADGTYSYDEPSNMDCKIGKYTYYGDQGPYWYWTCGGINGGASSSCYVYKSEDAICGEANGKTYVEEPDESYLCGVSAYIDKYYNDSYDYIDYWTDFSNNERARWLCVGLQGGADAWCSATRKHYTRYQCKFQNSRLERVPDTNTDLNPSIKKTYYLSNYIYASHIPGSTYYVGGGYACQCPVGQTFDSVKGCFTPVQPVNGACGSAKDTPTVKAPTNNLCAQGNSSNITTNTNTYNWTCGGVNSGTDASCSVSKLVVNGSCGTTAYNCISGSSISNVYSNNKYTWTCDGSNGGSSPQCSLCDGGYVLSGNVCVYWDQYRLEACTGKPANSERHNTTITQRKYWYNPGQYWTDWSPSLEGTYSATADSNYCYYKCSNGYTWNGASCVVASYQGYQCTYQGPSNPPVWQLIPYSSSGSKSPIGTYKNAEYIFTDNTAGYTCDPKEAGQCGSATATTGYDFPTTNLCSGGSVLSTGTYPSSFVWQCNGINGSTINVACSANRKRDGVCGPSNGMQINIPGGTEQNVKDALAASSGLCKYSYDTRTAASITLNTYTNSATWSCTPINGGTTASCTATYNISQVKCASKNTYLSNIYAPKEYYNIPQISKGSYWSGSSFSYSQVWTDDANNKITTVTKNYLVTGNFTCINGGNPTLNNEISTLVSVSTGYKCADGYVVSGAVKTTPVTSTSVCAKICDTSNLRCGAGRQAYLGTDGATWSSDFKMQCSLPPSYTDGELCNFTCPSGKFWNGSSCISITENTACGTTTNTCTGNVVNTSQTSCGSMWSCAYGNSGVYQADCSIECPQGKKMVNGSCVSIVCDSSSNGWIASAFSPATYLSRGSTLRGKILSSTYVDTTRCDFSCGGDCSTPSGTITITQSSCITTCNAGYQAVPDFGCCPKYCTGSADVKIAPSGNASSWTYDFENPYYNYDGRRLLSVPFTQYTCGSSTTGKYYLLKQFNIGDDPWSYARNDSSTLTNGDYVWDIYSCVETNTYKYNEALSNPAYDLDNNRIKWNGILFNWDSQYFYDSLDDSIKTDLPYCGASTSGKIYYSIGVKKTLTSGDNIINQEKDSLEASIRKLFSSKTYADIEQPTIDKGSSSVWKKYTCTINKTYKYEVLPFKKATAVCNTFSYNSCPSVDNSCSVVARCDCPTGYYYDNTSKSCKVKIFNNQKSNVDINARAGCIGRAGVYPSCDAGYVVLDKVNTDPENWRNQMSEGTCSFWGWKDRKVTLCAKYTLSDIAYSGTCLKSIDYGLCPDLATCYGGNMPPVGTWPYSPKKIWGKMGYDGVCR